MKKLLSVFLAAALVLLCAVCAAAETKTGLGIVTFIGASQPVGEIDGEKTNGRAQVDSTICAVTLDENGTIVAISFDVAQTRVAFTPEGALAADLSAPALTKREKGFDYNMKAVSAAGGTNNGEGFELFEQLDNLEAYCIGKTVEEVLATPVYQRDENHPAAPDAEDLKASVTITIGELLEALKKAAENAK